MFGEDGGCSGNCGFFDVGGYSGMGFCSVNWGFSEDEGRSGMGCG